MCNHHYIYYRGVLSVALLTISLFAMAHCGETRYDWGYDALHEVGTYVLTMMTAAVSIMYAAASLIALYSATSIYIKLNAGEEGFTKSVISLVGSILFLISATLVIPALFGVNYGTKDFDWGGINFWSIVRSF